MQEMKTNIAKINSFTFQANIEKQTARPLTARVVLNTKGAFESDGIWGISNAGHVSGRISGLSSSNMTAFKEGDEDGWDSCDDNHRLTYDSLQDNSRIEALDSDYPDLVRFYAIGTEVYWCTVNRTTLQPTNGTVYLEHTIEKWDAYPYLFRNYTSLTDVSGMFDWDFSGMDLCGYMFENTVITTFELNRTYKKSGFMYISRMFINCKKLTTVTMDIDTSEATYRANASQSDTSYSAQVRELFKGCSELRELNLSGDFTNIYNVRDMFNGCSSLTATEFKMLLQIGYGILHHICKQTTQKWRSNFLWLECC